MDTTKRKSLRVVLNSNSDVSKIELINFLEPIGYLQAKAEEIGNDLLAESLQNCVDIIYDDLSPKRQ